MTYYEETRRTFRLQVPDDFNFTRDVVDGWVARKPWKTALVAVDPAGENRRELTFADLSRASNRVANAFDGLGVDRGDRAFVMLPRIPEWYELLLGMARQGSVPMPGTVRLSARDIEYRVTASEASVAVTDPEGAAHLQHGRDGRVEE